MRSQTLRGMHGPIAARLDGEHQDEPVPHASRYSVGDNRIEIILDDGGTSSLWWATKNGGSGSSTSPVSAWRRSAVDSPGSRLPTIAGSTRSSPAAERRSARSSDEERWPGFHDEERNSARSCLTVS